MKLPSECDHVALLNTDKQYADSIKLQLHPLQLYCTSTPVNKHK